MNGILTVEPFFRIEMAGKEPANGYIFSLNAVYRIGGRKMAHVTIAFVGAPWAAKWDNPLRLPYLMPWEKFQKWLVRID